VANVLANMDQAILFKKAKVDPKEKEEEKTPPNSPELWQDSQLM